MKPTQEQVIAWAREAGMQVDPENSFADQMYLAVLYRAFTLAYEAGCKEENEAVAQIIEEAPPLVAFAKNEHGGCLICGFNSESAASYIRARRKQ